MSVSQGLPVLPEHFETWQTYERRSVWIRIAEEGHLTRILKYARLTWDDMPPTTGELVTIQPGTIQI